MFTMTLGSGIAIAAGCLSIAAMVCAGFIYLGFRSSWYWLREQMEHDKQLSMPQAVPPVDLPPAMPNDRYNWN